MKPRSWFEELVRKSSTWLTSRTLSPALRLRSNPKVLVAESGWYAVLGTLLPGGGGPALFLDRSFDAEERRLWFGYWSPTEEGVEQVMKAGRAKWKKVLENEDAMGLGQDAFRYPWLEHARAREEYFGFYDSEAPDFGKSPSDSLVARIGKTVIDLQPSLSAKGHSKTTKLAQRTYRMIRARQGQAEFRAALLKRYGKRCCVSGSTVIDVLEAAHIATFSGADLQAVENGLLLRSDLHTLFDLGLLRIHPQKLTVHVDLEARRPPYKGYHGKRLRITPDAAKLLDKTALTKRWAETAKIELRRRGGAK